VGDNVVSIKAGAASVVDGTAMDNTVSTGDSIPCVVDCTTRAVDDTASVGDSVASVVNGTTVVAVAGGVSILAVNKSALCNQ
jgi:hypothetical protein